MTTRRDLLLLMLVGSLAWPAAPAFADDSKDSGDGGGNDGGGDSGGGGDDGGGDGGGDDGGGGGDDGGDDGGGDSGGGGDHGGGNLHDDGDDDRGYGGDAGKARTAVRDGKAARLSDILRMIRKQYPGQVLHVDASSSADGLLYVIQILDPDNRRVEVTVNATTRKILSASLY